MTACLSDYAKPLLLSYKFLNIFLQSPSWKFPYSITLSYFPNYVLSLFISQKSINFSLFTLCLLRIGWSPKQTIMLMAVQVGILQKIDIQLVWTTFVRLHFSLFLFFKTKNLISLIIHLPFLCPLLSTRTHMYLPTSNQMHHSYQASKRLSPLTSPIQKMIDRPKNEKTAKEYLLEQK